MANFYPVPGLAMRLVNGLGVPQSPEFFLSQPNSYGITLGTTGPPRYVPETLGPHLFADYSMRPDLLGYRVWLRLVFSEILNDDATGTYGTRLLRQLYNASWSVGFAPLQVNLYNNYPGASAYWRGMYFNSPWDPVPLQGKQTPGSAMVWECELYARDLIPSIPDPFPPAW